MTPGAVLVTGGAGFVGSELVRRLVGAGREVHVLVRSATDRTPLAGVDVRWHEADLEDVVALRRAFAAAASSADGSLDAVHLAARISYRRADRELLRRANVEGTRHVLAAARAVRVRRLCLVSSVAALGPAPGPGVELDDGAPLGGLALDSAYARTKAESEELVAAADDLDWVVASPAVVFGLSTAGSNSTHFVERVVRGVPVLLSPPGSLSVVGLVDAAEGIRLALERGRRGRRYLLAESAWRVHELLALVRAQAGRRPPLGVVPRPLWSVLVGCARALELVVPGERVTSEALALMAEHFRFRARRAREELGWTPRPFPEVLAPIVEHVRRKGAR